MERNRDEWMPRMRRMGSCPCKQPGRPIARFRSNPSGSGLCGRSAALRHLPIAELLAAHRAWHPIPQRQLRAPWEITNTFLQPAHHCGRSEQTLRSRTLASGLLAGAPLRPVRQSVCRNCSRFQPQPGAFGAGITLIPQPLALAAASAATALPRPRQSPRAPCPRCRECRWGRSPAPAPRARTRAHAGGC